MVDQAKLLIRAGNGGNGAISFRREKFIPKGGPDGGDGGKGGSVYIETDPNRNTLDDFAHQQKFEATDGDKGTGKKMSGAKGEDLIIKVPLGTIVTLKPLSTGKIEVENIAVKGMPRELMGRLILKKVPEGNPPEFPFDKGEVVIDFDKPGMKLLIAKGGSGGRGNVHFMSARETTPLLAEQGQVGQGFQAELSLKLLADIGLVGLPNAGKSTLLSVLSNARPKIADYEFTTLEPNLGVMKNGENRLVIADFPGLIEGASEGKGLGIKFLKHIERAKVLIHLVPAGEDVEEAFQKYQKIRKELLNYGGEIEKKEEIVVLSKIDLVSEEKVKEIQKYFKKKKIEILPISGGNGQGLAELIFKLSYIH
ncbi:MAG: GTP-binding protein Obg/CgtA, GTP-binding protein [Microgenomates group bacterium GW2011_GWC1_44_10]|nr:MAG: GTP-binding protein Obg/CgtA, GTP-binding protein [Microgenomates group bacterium GW2011_GWC1_44_10]